jgi:hypothetical protein
MVLAMAGGRLNRFNGGKRCLREQFKVNYRKPRDLTENRHSGSLKKGQITLFQGMVKKRNDVAVDDDDDAVRTSEPRDSDTVF